MTPAAAVARPSSGGTSARESVPAVVPIGPASAVMINPANQNAGAPASQRYPRATAPVCLLAPTSSPTTAPAVASMVRTLTGLLPSSAVAGPSVGSVRVADVIRLRIRQRMDNDPPWQTNPPMSSVDGPG